MVISSQDRLRLIQHLRSAGPVDLGKDFVERLLEAHKGRGFLRSFCSHGKKKKEIHADYRDVSALQPVTNTDCFWLRTSSGLRDEAIQYKNVVMTAQ